MAFDTGNNIMAARDPTSYWGESTVKAYKPCMSEAEEFGAQLERKMGLKPADLKLVALSHGHLDHAGAIDNFAGTGVPSEFSAIT
jgi:N-acyl homoserine lactone hydrolase